MMKREEVNHLLYSLDNYAVEAGTWINTNIIPFSEDFNLTILFDFTYTLPSSGVGSTPYLMYVWNSQISGYTFAIRLQYTNSSVFSYVWQKVLGALANANKGGRSRIAVTHAAGSNTINISFKKDTGTRRNYSYTQTFTPASNSKLYFGRTANGNDSLPEGTITSAKVYDKILSAAEINAFFA